MGLENSTNSEENHGSTKGSETSGVFAVKGKREEMGGDGQGQSKVCARGHWRPAEDSKLIELVALYGPQNWNLIAENLSGRSGNENEKLFYFTRNELMLTYDFVRDFRPRSHNP